MRTILLSQIFLSIALFLGSAIGFAQTPDEASLSQAIESLRKAIIVKDRNQFEALLSDHLSYGHSAGRIETKKQFIDVATASKAITKSLSFTEQTQNVVGNNAIARLIYTSESELDGKTSTTKIGVLMVYQKEQGAWKLLARQAYRL